MSTLITRIQDLADRIAVEFHAHKLLINNNATDLSALTTNTKTDLVSALNELKLTIGAVIDDNSTGTSTESTWSSHKIYDEITAAINAVVNGAPAALDTLKELADALGDDSNFSATIVAALDNRVRVDASQTFNSTQQLQARTNIGAVASADVGDTDTDFIPGFEANL